MVGCALRAGKPAKHRRLELGTATMVRRLRRLANTCSRRWVGAEPLWPSRPLAPASVQACIRALVHAAARGVAVARAIGHDSRPDYVAAPTADDPAARSPQRREAPPNADLRSQPLVPARIRPAGEQSPTPSPRTCPVCLEVPTGDNSVLLCAPPRRHCPFPFGKPCTAPPCSAGTTASLGASRPFSCLPMVAAAPLGPRPQHVAGACTRWRRLDALRMGPQGLEVK